ncbi:MAG: cofactor-independent phosphoglycerate mutase [Clostridiales bacterium]|jgi:2,3-bisphosphoglycerate-independent phosphoglycerate mutase|nr:cofactor-independent phosphoglycerate mutase [Clostridiales bacterium]
MKYIVLLCDGMADTPCAALDNRTPMEAADKPCMDRLARRAEVGMVRTVQEGMSPGSDVANLTVMGYDTRECYTGRSPLEAANIGVELAEDDVAFRCNLVTLSPEEDYPHKRLTDYCAGDIHTAQAAPLVQRLQSAFGGGEFDFYTGTAYRHCLVWHHGKTALGRVTPPHDITGQVIGPYLPLHPDASLLLRMMEQSVELLKDQPAANAIWLWGQGSRPRLQNFRERTGKKGSVISAVDLIKGIGKLSGMRVCDVPGATGYIDTNYEGKRDAAIRELRDGQDFVYIHVEAPDECGHRGETDNKVKAIEDIDRRVLSPLLEELEKMGDYHLLILPDHPTPLAIRTHSAEPVPYLLYRSENAADSGIRCFTEEAVRSTGRFVEEGRTLIGRLWK